MEDPKKKAGDLKAPLHLFPTVALREASFVLQCGADKYGVYNWRESEGIKATTYIAAIKRHTDQFIDGEDADEETGRSHLAHLIATCAILLDAERVGKLVDDRPKVKKAVALWEAPCTGCFARQCANAKTPVVCGSCMKTPNGWTNYRSKAGE